MTLWEMVLTDKENYQTITNYRGLTNTGTRGDGVQLSSGCIELLIDL